MKGPMLSRLVMSVGLCCSLLINCDLPTSSNSDKDESSNSSSSSSSVSVNGQNKKVKDCVAQYNSSGYVSEINCFFSDSAWNGEALSFSIHNGGTKSTGTINLASEYTGYTRSDCGSVKYSSGNIMNAIKSFDNAGKLIITKLDSVTVEATFDFKLTSGSDTLTFSGQLKSRNSKS